MELNSLRWRAQGHRMDRVLWRILLYISLGEVIYCLRHPVHSGVTRMGMLLSVVGLFVVSVVGLWRVRRSLAILPVLVLL